MDDTLTCTVQIRLQEYYMIDIVVTLKALGLIDVRFLELRAGPFNVLLHKE